eukprot:TRINITY_DN15675_c0_g1_i1.p1 TRINITY_DN15675_c0_g1~~TRINITY_DN15675_c0_g1_i1.p1  ORF type:complete len:424 (+),score=123.04 TRINITY_DN15675_c0_g1_i1:54-1325(+)
MADVEKLKVLSAQEQELRRQKADIETEVKRLQAMVEEAHANLKASEASAEDAGKKLEEATTAIKLDLPTTEGKDAHTDPVFEEPVRMVRKRISFTKAVGEKLGLFFSNKTTEITRVFPGMAASKAGLQTGMHIKQVNGSVVTTLSELDACLAATTGNISFEVDVEADDEDEDSESNGSQPGREAVRELDHNAIEEASREGQSDDDFVLVSEAPLPDAQVQNVISPQHAARDGHFGVEVDEVGRPPMSTPALKEKHELPLKAAHIRDGTDNVHEMDEKQDEKEEETNTEQTQDQKEKEEGTAQNTGAAWMPSPMEIDLSSFKKFCKDYADAHPEMIAPDYHEEDPQEEVMRLQEERRMRELQEDPIAIRELLERTISNIDENKRIEKNLAVHLETDDWKKDYEERVRKKEAMKAKFAADGGCIN